MTDRRTVSHERQTLDASANQAARPGYVPQPGNVPTKINVRLGQLLELDAIRKRLEYLLTRWSDRRMAGHMDTSLAHPRNAVTQALSEVRHALLMLHRLYVEAEVRSYDLEVEESAQALADRHTAVRRCPHQWPGELAYNALCELGCGQEYGVCGSNRLNAVGTMHATNATGRFFCDQISRFRAS